jgi:hypothetical protein
VVADSGRAARCARFLSFQGMVCIKRKGQAMVPNPALTTALE